MTITLPLSVTLPRKTKADKVWILNLNTYRNANFHILNDAKVHWKDVVAAALYDQQTGFYCGNMLVTPPFRFTYTVYSGSNRKFDLANVCSIIDKFTCDALIEFGVITDDSYKIIPEIDYRFGGVDKENPRVTLEISSI